MSTVRLHITFHADGSHTHDDGSRKVTHYQECLESRKIRAVLRETRESISEQWDMLDNVLDAIGGRIGGQMRRLGYAYPFFPSFEESPLSEREISLKRISLIPRKAEEKGNVIWKTALFAAVCLGGIGVGCYFADPIRNMVPSGEAILEYFCSEAAGYIPRLSFCPDVCSA